MSYPVAIVSFFPSRPNPNNEHQARNERDRHPGVSAAAAVGHAVPKLYR